MSVTESPVASPAPGWARRFPRDEKLFFVLIMATTLLMTLFAVGWVVWSDHNVPTTTQSVQPAAFAARVQAFAKQYGDGEGRAWVPPGEEAYLLATRYSWYPELVLQEGEEYLIWMSAGDVLHGFGLVGGTQNLNLELAPNHGFGVRLTPGEPGRYRIICNEYCGLGHQDMTSFLTVVSAEEMRAHVAGAHAPAAPEEEESGGGGAAAGALELSAAADGSLAYDVTELEAKAGTVTISMANPSAVPHNVAIKGNGVDVKGAVVLQGGTSTVSAELEPGTYTFYCSVPGHEAAGMKGTLVVT